jgi:hypothetical protein
MRKNTRYQIMLRFQAMEAALRSKEGLHLNQFAEQWHITPKQVKNDLDVFEDWLKYQLKRRADDYGRNVRWYADRHVRRRPFFAANFHPQVREVGGCPECVRYHKSDHALGRQCRQCQRYHNRGHETCRTCRTYHNANHDEAKAFGDEDTPATPKTPAPSSASAEAPNLKPRKRKRVDI